MTAPTATSTPAAAAPVAGPTPPQDPAAERTVDVLIVSDLRFPGGTSHSVGEEITAQHRAGWRTGLLHLNGPMVSRVTPVNPLLQRHVRAGRARLLVGDEPITAKIVVVRHPAVIQHAAAELPPIRTEQLVVVANAPAIGIDGARHYDPPLVDEICRQHFGLDPTWSPIGPLVRDSIAAEVRPGAMPAEDWVNIIDVDSWDVRGQAWCDERVPVIGRHSRNSPQKWPNDKGVLQAVYPTDASMRVRVLGGAQSAEAVLGHPAPPSWEVQAFGRQSPKDFLAGLDFFVYHHDPRWVEAFGRTILEALASGVPAVLAPHFEALFGDAALYAEPDQVAPLIHRLRGDRVEYERIRDHAVTRVRERFGYEAHVARLTSLIGAPEAPAPESTPGVEATVPPAGDPTDPAAPAEPGPHAPGADVAARPGTRGRPRLLLISSNGAGMGHLTRLLSYARRAEDRLEPSVFSLSQAVGVAGSMGYGYEYLPSTGATGLAPRRWHPIFVRRVLSAIDRLQPDVIVFDGTWPYDGIRAVRAQRPGPRWVWSRRALWRAGLNAEQLDKAEWFDAVLEPGDLAAPLDRGLTVDAEAHRVGPVTLLDVADLTEREEARAALGLPADGPLALLSLGAGNINDTSSDTGAAIAALRELGVGVCLTRGQIAGAGEVPEGVHPISAYPLSRHFRAFDLSVSATGYNSFHEVLRFGLPTLFVPNTGTALDDTEARSRWADQQDWSHQLAEITVETALPLLSDLLQRGPEMAAKAQRADPGNGAVAAAELMVSLASQRRSA